VPGGEQVVRVSDALGRFGEETAARHLERAGLVILDRNWRCVSGELDIVARDGGCLVFCEVKTRSSVAFGTPAEAVGPVKAARIRRLAASWLDGHPQGGAPVRFDVVAVTREDGGLRVEHLRAAF
jgi:putative endonuclease